MADYSLQVVMQKGFQKIWSRHNYTNNEVIIPMLKRGFKITGTELTDTFGALVHLTYFPSPLRQKVLEFRAGMLKPDAELNKVFGIES